MTSEWHRLPACEKELLHRPEACATFPLSSRHRIFTGQSQIIIVSNKLILEDGSSQRKHRQQLNNILAATKGTLRIASAYVTERELLSRITDRERRLLTSLSPMDIASGATSIETLGALIKSGVNCRSLPERPRLHAKVYIFGTSRAVITSANLTDSAFNSNIEVGVEVNADQANQLAAWFDTLWDKAVPVTPVDLSGLRSSTALLRAEFVKLKKKTKTKWQVSECHKPPHGLSDSFLDLFANAKQYFVCNTNRRYDERTDTGVYPLEEEMRNRGFAAAWETFKFPSHMKQVKRGDAIFMFAKGIGIIGIGTAKDRCEKLTPNDPGRISTGKTAEWRVPVQWLEWTDECGACQWKEAPNFTFWDVTEEQYAEFRGKVKNHFLCHT